MCMRRDLRKNLPLSPYSLVLSVWGGGRGEGGGGQLVGQVARRVVRRRSQAHRARARPRACTPPHTHSHTIPSPHPHTHSLTLAGVHSAKGGQLGEAPKHAAVLGLTRYRKAGLHAHTWRAGRVGWGRGAASGDAQAAPPPVTRLAPAPPQTPAQHTHIRPRASPTCHVVHQRHQHAHVALVLLGPHPVVQHNGQGQEQVEDVALAPPKVPARRRGGGGDGGAG